VNGTNNREIVTAGLKLIKLAIGKECHIAKAVFHRLNTTDGEDDLAKSTLLLEVLMCASKDKAYDVASPTMDLLRAYLDSINAGTFKTNTKLQPLSIRRMSSMTQLALS
jgi:hypothetical protein